jgi:hypothetical protein
MMKARSSSLTLYHFAEGHHRDVCVWHDQDHKPEVVATTPGIFISQRWVAPPDLMAIRSPSTLPHNGGEYVNLYWSTSSADELHADFDVLGRRLELVGRMQPMQYIERTFGRRLEPVSFQIRPGLELSAEAVACAPQNQGLFLVIGELQPGQAGQDYARWHESEHIPEILQTGVFSGAAKLMSAAADEANLVVVLYYSDRDDPVAAYQEFQAAASGLSRFPDAERAFRRVHSGMYRPSIGFYDYYA